MVLDLFVEHGFDGVGLDHIAEVAEVSKTTFYRYFETKEDLLFGRASEHLALVRSVFEVAARRRVPGRGRPPRLRRGRRLPDAPRQKLAVSCVIKLTPSLAAGSQANQAAWEEYLRGEVARRQPDADPFHTWILASEGIATDTGPPPTSGSPPAPSATSPTSSTRSNT